MVMAGENAATDVDEEVYGNGGAERHKAQEASAGGRRAIADAGQAGQLDISGEKKTAGTIVLLNHPQTLRGWHTTRHTLHSETLLRVADEVLRTDELWRTRRRILYRNSRRITCSFERWQRAKLSHALHSGGQLHVRSERWL